MKNIQQLGLILFLIALGLFTSLLFVGNYTISETTFNNFIKDKGIKSELFITTATNTFVNVPFKNSIEASNSIISTLETVNETHKKNQEWDQIIWDKAHSFSYSLLKPSISSPVNDHKNAFWFLTFGLAILGGLLFILPNIKLLGSAGIKNNNIYFSSATNRGWIGMIACIALVGFYLLLYFRPDYIINWVLLVDNISLGLSGNPASQWFLYGFLYCTIMTLMAVRMGIKYRHNNYQLVRTTVVLFFQVAFAFLIPELLVRFNKPYFDFKNAWPLDYDFFFDWNINSLIDHGNLGVFMLVWGILLTLVIVPILVYFYGKRWYCSWVCGCGGLAETLGDPYRQLSDKSLLSWKIERVLVISVLIFATLMTAATLYTYFSGVSNIIGLSTYDIQYYYGFLIGSIFSGVIGTGLYPIFGNRVWCRFGCPLAAYLGILQKLKSRFRITTNGGQCISCGNCSTYCEMGIDVRSYAQKGQNIVRASCVGCGVCAAVCPRGVLKLENGPLENRVDENPVLLGNDIDLLAIIKKGHE